jgi:zinc transport system substrate-binding protein
MTHDINKIDKIMILVLLLLAPLLCGCISQNELPYGKINVATTIAPLADFITAVGGDKVKVTVLIPPGAEPHTYEPTPTQMKDVALADLYVMNGGGLEFWMDKVLQVNKKMLIVDSSRGVELVNESGGETDPHIWISLRNAAIQVNNICTGLIQVDPANGDYYRKNRDDYLQKLKALDEGFNQTFAAKKGLIFIVYHPAWTYFARDYNLDQVPILENEKEPGPKYLGSIIDLARKNNITVIFVEPQYNPKSAEVIAQEIKARVVALDPLGQNYLENMQYAGQEIAKSLK